MPRPSPAERRSYQKRIMGTGFPQVDTDKFNPSDYFLDQYHLHGFISDVLHRLIEVPVISSGLVVSNSGDNLVISAGVALCGYSEDSVIPHNNDGTPLTTRPVQNLIGFAHSPGDTFAIAGSGAIGDGVTLNAVRARAVWEDDETRNYQSNPLSSYPFLRVLRLDFAVNPAVPADYPLHLGGFICTLTGPTVSGFSYVSTARADSFRANFEDAPRSSVAATLPTHLVRLGEIVSGFTVLNETASGGPYYGPSYFVSASERLKQITLDHPSGITFGGFAQGTPARVLLITRLGGTVTLLHNSGSAAAGDRIWSPTGSDISLESRQSALLIYTNLGSESYWLAVSTGGGGGSSGGLIQTSALTYNIQPTDGIIYGGGSGATSWVLPNVSSVPQGKTFTLKSLVSSPITITAVGGSFIETLASYVLDGYRDSITVVATATGYIIV